MDTRDDSAKLVFKQVLASIPGVKATTMSNYAPGMRYFTGPMELQNVRGEMQSLDVLPYMVDYDYLGQLHMPIVAGRDFSRVFGTDSMRALILNETAVRELGYTSPA